MDSSSFEVTDSLQSQLLATGDHEMLELIDKNSAAISDFGQVGGGPVSIVPGAAATGPAVGAAASFDVCREYGYKYEDTECEDDHDDQGVHGGTPDPPFSAGLAAAAHGAPLSTASRRSRASPDWSCAEGPAERSMIYILGRTYDPVHDFSSRRGDESSLFWMTYRRDFLGINPYGITSDAGWGCMLRSAQMMLCHALRLHYVGREWTPPKSFVRRRDNTFVRNSLTWFADFPSLNKCRYSLHNMCAAGFKYEMLPGEWYGPQTACHVLKDLCELHQSSHEEELEVADLGVADSDALPMFRVFVAQEGSVYRDEVEKLMTRDGVAKMSEGAGDAEVSEEAGAVADSEAQTTVIEDPLLNNPSELRPNSSASPRLDWDTPMLLLVPLRLGLKTFNAEVYRQPLAHTFALHQSVGFVGGTPRHALWFYGASSDGTKVYGLDPHTVQDSPRRGENSNVILSDEYLRSVHCMYPSTMDMSRIDPSLALAFYCRDRSDFDDLCRSLEGMKVEGKKCGIAELFSVADAAPDYCANVSSAMVEMYDDESESEIGKSDSDEEYIML